MISKENKQKLICLSGMCEHDPGDDSCLFLKYVDKGPEAFCRIIERIIEDEIKVRNTKAQKNVKRKKSVRK